MAYYQKHLLSFVASLLLILNLHVEHSMAKEVVPVGVVLDLNSTVGGVAKRCMSMALSDFYAANDDYYTRIALLTKDSGNDVIAAASAVFQISKRRFKIAPKHMESYEPQSSPRTKSRTTKLATKTIFPWRYDGKIESFTQTSCSTDVQEDETHQESQIKFKNMSSSTTDPSSSFGKRSLGQPLCFCEVEAQLRFSATTRNPGRPFLGCPKYNTKGLPYCKYFKWVEGDEYKKSDLRETHYELLRTKKELEKILDEIEKSKIDLHKRADEIEMKERMLSSRNKEVVNKELALVLREAQIRRSRSLLRVYWAFAFVVACYLSCLYK